MKDYILVVEDDSGIRETLAEILSIEGYNVLTATDGKDAWQKVSARTPELVITDVMMPRMSGTELVERMKSNGHHSPIILISAAPIKLAPEWSLDVYKISKPLNLDDLITLVTQLTSTE